MNAVISGPGSLRVAAPSAVGGVATAPFSLWHFWQWLEWRQCDGLSPADGCPSPAAGGAEALWTNSSGCAEVPPQLVVAVPGASGLEAAMRRVSWLMVPLCQRPAVLWLQWPEVAQLRTLPPQAPPIASRSSPMMQGSWILASQNGWGTTWPVSVTCSNFFPVSCSHCPVTVPM